MLPCRRLELPRAADVAGEVLGDARGHADGHLEPAGQLSHLGRDVLLRGLFAGLAK